MTNQPITSHNFQRMNRKPIFTHAQNNTPRPGHDEQGDVALVEKTDTKPERPKLYKVLLLNDDFTPMDFVVVVLRKFFGITESQAFDLMLTVHTKGRAVVGVFTYEVAETKVTRVLQFAREHGHPLQCTMEKEE